MSLKYGVVDLFAGPGGLAEGFAGARRPDGTRPYSIVLSIEKEASAHRTLTLRSFLRQFGEDFPQEYYDALNAGCSDPVDRLSSLYPVEWKQATSEAIQLELGKGPHDDIDTRLDGIREAYSGNTILIGGPPCQAYSLVGRARNMGIAGYTASEDHRHFLYQEYIRILTRLQPAVFVMENVKGILSSRVGQEKIFDKILADLQGIEVDGQGYVLVALREGGAGNRNGHLRPQDFVVRAEDYGIPQTRHRVIVVGLRPDIARRVSMHQLHGGLLTRTRPAVLSDVLAGMPELRSGLSQEKDTTAVWKAALINASQLVVACVSQLGDPRLIAAVRRYDALIRGNGVPESRNALEPNGVGDRCPSALRDWILNSRLNVVLNHETRGHMRGDLARYFFAAVFAEIHGRSPKAHEYPDGLAPSHRNWQSGKFADRFRVQRKDHPSSTITSHISKDGHYFIHPDPVQCRSLTVREAARLQTFPDDYLFLGNRTQQYVQVGNAVPPLLARQIAESLLTVLERAEYQVRLQVNETQLSYL